MTDDPTELDLAAEVAGLRARLAEAEAVLHAIRHGDVDAVLVTGEHGEHVYTLSGADRSYRQLVETMSEGAASLSADGLILYCNVRLAEMLGRPLDQVLGTAFRSYLLPADQRTLDAALEQAHTAPSRLETNLRTSAGVLVPIYLSASRLQDIGAETVLCLVLTDLTAQKSHEQIATAERLASLILDQVAEGIVVCDEQGRIIRASQAAQGLCDGSPFLRPFAEVFPLGMGASGPFRLDPVLQGETLRDLDVTLDRRGQKLGLILNAGPLLSGQQVIGCVVTLTDITERRRAEESSKKFMLGIQRSNDAIFMTDTEGNITFVNLAFEKLYGFAASEALGKTPRILKAPVANQDLPFYRRFWGRLLGKQVVAVDLTNQTKDGRTLQIAASVNPILDEAGTLVGFLAIHRDMTESRQTQAALERSRRDFRRVIDGAPDGITIRRGREFVYVNPAFAACLGYADPVELLGKDILATLVRPASQPTVLARFEAPDASGTLVQEVVRKDGQTVVLEFSPSQLIEFDGGPAHVTTARDVTQRNKLQAQLHVSDRMASVGTLAAGVAHEINNPLAAAMMNVDMARVVVADLLKGGALGSSSKLVECSEMLSDARGAAGQVREIVRDLKVFSRGEEDSRAPVDIHRILDATLRMAWTEIRHRARLVKDYGRILPVDASEARLGQVFLNLVVNAAQAIPEGRAETNEIRVVTRTDADGRVVVEVRDTGPGMAPDVLRRLFTPFFTTKPVGEGTGLGLSICHRLVNDLGGRIDVESEVGKGSVFRVSMPASRAESIAPAPAVAAHERAAGAAARGRVLVIDDEETVARAVGRTLSGEHDVRIVRNAAAALERIRAAEPFDVILCDLMMPDMTGMDFYDALRDFAPALAERVIFMSGGAFTAKARAFLDAVPNARLEKPFEPATLRTLVRDRVANSQGLQR